MMMMIIIKTDTKQAMLVIERDAMLGQCTQQGQSSAEIVGRVNKFKPWPFS